MAGWVSSPADVAEFCRLRLATGGRLAATATTHAHRLFRAGAEASQWTRLDGEYSARIPSEASRNASRLLGSGLRRLLVATAAERADILERIFAGCRPAPHQPIVLGAGTAITGADERGAARAAALLSCTGPASAAVRLLGLDPYAVHRVVAELSAEIEAVADLACTLDLLPTDSAPALDLLADVHARSEVRLFAS
jgi:urease accessory protein